VVPRLVECYLVLLARAPDSTGVFHNRLGHDRRWADGVSLGDWWGEHCGAGTRTAGRLREAVATHRRLARRHLGPGSATPFVYQRQRRFGTVGAAARD